MAERDHALFAGAKDQIDSLRADLKEMIELRRELAELELKTAIGLAKRLAVCLLVVGVAILVSLPVLVVAVGVALDGCLGVPTWGWLLAAGLVLLIGSVAGGYLAWRWFRRRFSGMEQTLEELREDLAWLKQWSPQGTDPQPAEEHVEVVDRQRSP